MQDTIICRCEEITLKDIQEIAEKHNSSAREIKLLSRAGMGFCGGRTCRPAIDKILMNITKDNPSDVIPLKVAPPVRPISLTDLGGFGKDDQ